MTAARIGNIPFEAAQCLVDCGGWAFDIDVEKLLNQGSERLDPQWQKRPIIELEDQDWILQAAGGFNDALRAHFEHYDIIPGTLYKGRAWNTQIVVGGNAVFKISEAIKDTMLNLAAIAAMVAAPGPSWGLAIGIAASSADLVRKLSDQYIKITDPTERAVFYAVCKLSTRLKIINRIAAEAEHFWDAVGTEPPTRSEIVAEMSAVPKEDVRRALGDLITKGALVGVPEDRIKAG